MAATGPQNNFTRPDEVAAYVAVVAWELVTLAHRHDLVLLSYLLDMVRLEAKQRSRPEVN